MNRAKARLNGFVVSQICPDPFQRAERNKYKNERKNKQTSAQKYKSLEKLSTFSEFCFSDCSPFI